MTSRALLLVTIMLTCGCASVDRDPARYPAYVQCQSASNIADEQCRVDARESEFVFLRGTILGDDVVYIDGGVLIDGDGKVVALGCDLDDVEPAKSATRVECPGAIISPGFINAHDHIFYNHKPPSKLSDERYDHRHQWRLGLEGHTQPDYERATSAEQVAWGELRHILAGTTSISALGGVPGLARNLDDALLSGELGTAAAFATVFPLGDAAGTLLSNGCAYPELISTDATANAGSFHAHVAEGVDDRAANEIRCLTGRASDAVDVANMPAAFIHFIAATADDVIFVRDNDISVIWSPRSNIALYGQTANVSLMDRLGVNIALSTDWLPSGSMNLSRELNCAANYSARYLDGYFDSHDLWKMVTNNAAKSFSMEGDIGSIAVGQIADIAVFQGSSDGDPFQQVISAGPLALLFALRSGRPVVGESLVANALANDATRCEQLPPELVCGRDIAVCFDSSDTQSVQSILAANQDSYALMSCSAIPENEPTCEPSWPGVFDGQARPGSDDDGDGVSNNADNCPAVFNPIRPMDNGRQSDWDRDAVGDACDDNPLERSQ